MGMSEDFVRRDFGHCGNKVLGNVKDRDEHDM